MNATAIGRANTGLSAPMMRATAMLVYSNVMKNTHRLSPHSTPATRLAAIRFSGFWSKANYEEHLGKLHAALRRAGLQSIGAPVYSRYDAPWTPWFMRRNEIWLRLGPESG